MGTIQRVVVIFTLLAFEQHYGAIYETSGNTRVHSESSTIDDVILEAKALKTLEKWRQTMRSESDHKKMLHRPNDKIVEPDDDDTADSPRTHAERHRTNDRDYVPDHEMYKTQDVSLLNRDNGYMHDVDLQTTILRKLLLGDKNRVNRLHGRGWCWKCGWMTKSSFPHNTGKNEPTEAKKPKPHS